MARWIAAVVGIAVLGCSLPAFAQTSAPRTNIFGRSSITVARSASRLRPRTANAGHALLRKRVAKVEWTDVAFEDVIEWLKDLAGEQANVNPRWRHLDVEGVDRDSLVTLSLKRTMVAKVLDEALDQLSEDGQVTYQAEGDTLTISTRSDFDRKLELRTYQVSDIVFPMPDMGRNAPTIDLDQASQQGGGGGGGGGQSIFGGQGGQSSEDLEVEESELEEALDDLVALIQAHIAPTSWVPAGGTGTISHFNNRVLIVRNTIEVHEQIGGRFVRGR